jgi:hypothetical protein
MIIDINDRQSGKTTRLIKQAFTDFGNHINVMIVGHNMDSALRTFKLLREKIMNHYSLSVVENTAHSMKLRDGKRAMCISASRMEINTSGIVMPLEASKNHWRVYYDEFDFYVDALDAHLLDSNGYYCSTPESGSHNDCLVRLVNRITGYNQNWKNELQEKTKDYNVIKGLLNKEIEKNKKLADAWAKTKLNEERVTESYLNMVKAYGDLLVYLNKRGIL